LIFPVTGIRSLTRGYTGAPSKVETLKVTLRVTTMMRIALPVAAAAALICCDVSQSHAQYYGDAPWCAVVSIGTGGVHWDCEYNTVEACVPNVIAGNRGFCGMNPYYRSGYQAGTWQGSPPPHYAHHPRHQTHTYHHSH
jgi:Protein of unknown function (DUF3551)